MSARSELISTHFFYVFFDRLIRGILSPENALSVQNAIFTINMTVTDIPGDPGESRTGRETYLMKGKRIKIWRIKRKHKSLEVHR